jgi:hypothetical protein
MSMLRIPEEQEERRPRPSVRRFSEAMELKLKANDHKGGWHNMPLWYLLARLKEETIELEAALERAELSETQVAFEAAMQEAVDVSNFCMMIWEVIELRMKEKDAH